MHKILTIALSSFLFVACSSENQEKPVANFQVALTGEALFEHEFSAKEGLGPHFNATSCAGCHNAPALGGRGDGIGTNVLDFGHLDFLTRQFTDLKSLNFGPAQREHSVVELGGQCEVPLLRPIEANSFSLRTAPTLFGLGLVAKIADEDILAHAVDKGDGIFGKANMVKDDKGNLKVGRFGWKAQNSELITMVADAFKNEMGLTNSRNPQDNFPLDTPNITACDGYNTEGIELSDESITKVLDFIVALPTHSHVIPDINDDGYRLFEQTLCVKCHVPSFHIEGEKHYFYSDFLMHDMGSGLNDGFVQGLAKGEDWRTTPLQGINTRDTYIHDGRVHHIAKIIHNLDLNDEKYITPEAEGIKLILSAIRSNEHDDIGILKKSDQIFDYLYQSFKHHD